MCKCFSRKLCFIFSTRLLTMRLLKGVLRVDSARRGCRYLITRPPAQGPFKGAAGSKCNLFVLWSKPGKIKGCLGKKGKNPLFYFQTFYCFSVIFFSSPSTFNVDFCLVFLWPWLIFSISDPRALKRSNIQQKLEGCQSWMKTLSTLLISQKKCI